MDEASIGVSLVRSGICRLQRQIPDASNGISVATNVIEMQRLARTLLVAMMLVLFTACSRSAAPQTLQLGPAPWSSGERATYQLTANGTPAGTATLEATERLDSATGQPSGWLLRTEVDGRGDKEIVSITLGAQGYRPIESTLVRILTDGTEQVKATYNGSAVNLELTSRSRVLTYEELSVPSDAREQRSLPWLVRTLPLDAGYATRLNALLPITGNLDRVSITMGREETITVPAGTFETMRVSLDTGDSLSRMWIGTDAPHPLIKFEDDRSHATWELSQFEAGNNE